MNVYMVINRLKLHNANAFSSVLTVGFPAVTGFLGGTHNLGRKLRKKYPAVGITSTGIVCHDYQMHSYQLGGNAHKSLAITANPAKKDGERSSFIPEGRIDLMVSLILKMNGVTGDNEQAVRQFVKECVPTMKIAGGDIITFKDIQMYFIDEADEYAGKKMLYRLMPGFALLERRELLVGGANDTDPLQGLLDIMKINFTAEKDDEGKVLGWEAKRAQPGWIVPIAVGFKGISTKGKVQNQRDNTVEHQFAETLLTVGEFVLASRLESVEAALWRYDCDQEKSVYRCVNEGYSR